MSPNWTDPWMQIYNNLQQANGLRPFNPNALP